MQPKPAVSRKITNRGQPKLPESHQIIVMGYYMDNRNSNSIAVSVEAPSQSAYAEDLQLAQSIAAGNRALFRQIYSKNVNTLYNLAKRMVGSATEADDVVQDAFVRAYQKINLYAGRSSLSSWLYRICINSGLEHLRKKKGTFEEITDSNCHSVEPNQTKVILRRRLETAISKLPKGCRTVFILHDVEGFNHREIAERLCLAEGTSKSQLFKAREMLRKILSGKQEA